MPIIKTEELPNFDKNGKLMRGRTILIYRLPLGSEKGLLGLFGSKWNESWKEVVKEDFSRWTDFEKLNKTINLLPMVHNEAEEEIISNWLKSNEKYPNKKMEELILLHRKLGYRCELKYKD